MDGLANPNPSHKLRSEFLATTWFAHLMSDEQINTVVDNKLGEIDEFLEMIEQFQAINCPGMGTGAQFVAGYGKHMASAFKQYVEENRQLLAGSAVADAKVATG